jgi:AbrB family looped-hinge helix DNA binding protein
MAVATITSKGQATIPLVVRQSLGLHPGDQIEFAERADGAWVVQALDLSVDDIAGCVVTSHAVASVSREDEAMVAAATRDFR